MERKYYLVDPNGKSMVAIKEWRRLHGDATEKAFALSREFNACLDYLRTNERIIGFVFEKDPGRGWRPVHNYSGVYSPDKRIKEGKEIAKRLDTIRIPGNRMFAELIGGGFLIITDDRHWVSVSFENIGNDYVISVPVSQKIEDEFIPPDARLLKMSEYFKMKEDETEKRDIKTETKS